MTFQEHADFLFLFRGSKHILSLFTHFMAD